MKSFIVIMALLVATNSLLAKSIVTNLDYTFCRKDSTSLSITVSFKGNNTGSTLLRLPNEWAGQQMLFKAVSTLHAISNATFIDTTSQPENYLVRYRPGSIVSIVYILHQGWRGPLRYPYFNRPVISRNLFYFEGYSGLIYPDFDDNLSFNCTIVYKDFPKEEFKGNSFFSNNSSGTFHCNIRNLRNSFFCAGNFRTKTVSMEGHQIVMVVNGTFPYTDEEAFSSIAKIILEERKFWGDPGSPYYFTLTMSTDDRSSCGGTAHHDSFCLFQSSDVQLTNGILQTISHEYFHNWIGSVLKNPMPDGDYKWFSEGFTDYYSLKLLNKTGLISNTDFVKKLNEDISQYYLSPHFNADSLEMIGKYWTGEDWRQLSYRRGLTIAFTLDLKIQENNSSLSLDDLMKELYKRSKPSMIFSKSLFDVLVFKYSGEITLNAVNGAIHGKNEMLTIALLSNKIYKIDQLAIHQIFDKGFDVVASKKEKKIMGLKPGSNAEKAGLRENMPFTGNVGFWINNIEKPCKVEVIVNDKKEWVNYIPVANVDIQIPQVVY